ncbi:MAG: hypothetical protein HYY78_12135 [Betaproteobacteria bacterium]|nr:hypothetical protein [Betaproteobacteria bacterium]
MAKFDSLKAALKDYFDKPLCGLPKYLQDRVNQDFSPMPWDVLDAAQRRLVAEQWDYQNDPATLPERERLWDESCVDWAYWRKLKRLTALEFCILRHVHDPRKFEGDRNSIPGGTGKTLDERVSDDMRIIAREKDNESSLSLIKWIALAEQQSWVIPSYMRAEVGRDGATDAQGQHPQAVTARKIETEFIIGGVPESNKWWRTRMSNASRYGLSESRANRGRGKTPSLWYPDRIACWLESKGHLTKKQAANILRKHFPDCADSADLLDPPE